MRQIKTIMAKELKDYFISPIAYIVIAIFLLVTGWFFFATFFLFNQADLRGFFNLLPITFAFVIPAVTMRLFAEERNLGSYELLLTLPVDYTDIILGKFLAGVLFMAAALVPTLVYGLCISALGDVDWGTVIGGYLGALLLAGSFTAIGLWASATTRNQIIAFIIGALVCFILTLLDKILFFMPSAVLGVVGYLATGVHFENIAKGIVDTRDILYFLSVIFVGLYATHLALTANE